MGKRNFRALLEGRWLTGNFVCVGLDSEYAKIPEHVRAKRGVIDGIIEFNSKIVHATKDTACAYKPNVAFYEAHGDDGLIALEGTIDYIHLHAPNVPVILDAKRADIDNTNNGYVEMAFERMKADAITVNPYFGGLALAPFLDCADKGIIVLCRTSNKGGGEFQNMDTDGELGFVPLYQHVAERVSSTWNKNNNCALVVGATCPEELGAVRKIVGDMPILIPGIGAQGGDVGETVRAGKDSRGRGMIINSSRGIIFASSGEDFAEAARRETLKLHDMISRYR